jgi:RNA recognition motif-containing protein
MILPRGAPEVRRANADVPGRDLTAYTVWFRMKKIYVGNLSFATTEADLRDAFGRFGEVHSVAIVTDRDTGRSRGFGFVEMDDPGATTAINEMNGTQLGERELRVNEAHERGQQRPRREPRGRH